MATNIPESYCFKCKKKTPSVDNVEKENVRGRKYMLSKCEICDCKKCLMMKGSKPSSESDNGTPMKKKKKKKKTNKTDKAKTPKKPEKTEEHFDTQPTPGDTQTKPEILIQN